MNREELLRALEEVDWSGLDRHNADIAEEPRMTLYRAYRAERNSGKTHAQIVSDGIFGKAAEEYAIQYSQEQAIYADYMNRRAERDSIGDCDIFGRPMKAGN